MGRGLSLEGDKTLQHCHLHLSHCSYYFPLLLPSQSSHLLCHCCLLLQMLRCLMNRLTLKGQGSDLGLRSLGMGSQLRPERMEEIHKRSQFHIYQWGKTGFALQDSHSLFRPYQSSGLGLVVN